MSKQNVLKNVLNTPTAIFPRLIALLTHPSEMET